MNNQIVNTQHLTSTLLYEKAHTGASTARPELGDVSFNSRIKLFSQGMIETNDLLPPYWSRKRNLHSYYLSVQNGFLSSAIHNISNYLSQLPWHIAPRDDDIHSDEAVRWGNYLNSWWLENSTELIIEMLRYDTGAYIIVHDSQEVDAGLDSPSILPQFLEFVPTAFIDWTDSETFPIKVKRHNDEAYQTVHKSKIIQLVLPSGNSPNTPKQKIFTKLGLGFVSKVVDITELMRTQIKYDWETMSGINAGKVVFGGDISAKYLKSMWAAGIQDARNANRTSSDAVIFIGSKNPNAKLQIDQLKNHPNGLNRTAFYKDMLMMIALAAGVDANVLVNDTGAGTTKSASLISDLKGKGKLDRWLINSLKIQLESHILPTNLMVVAGEVSKTISETQAKAQITYIRALDIPQKNGTISPVTGLKMYYDAGIMKLSEYHDELLSRNIYPPTRTHISTIFYASDSALNKYLDNLPDDPCAISEVLLISYLDDLEALECILMADIASTTSARLLRKYKALLAAVRWLIGEIDRISEEEDEIDFQNSQDELILDISDVESDEQLLQENAELQEELETKAHHTAKARKKKRRKLNKEIKRD